MKDSYREAFSEVNAIFNLMPQEMLNKIPNRFKQIIYEEKSVTYQPIIKEPIEECTLKEETIIILALIYRDFLCDKEESQKLKFRDAVKLKEAEDELRGKYNPDNLFKNKKEKNKEIFNEQSSDTNLPVEIKNQPFYKKILNLIKKFLNL